MTEALETASRVKYVKKEDRILMMCKKIKDRCFKELIQRLYKASSQSVMVVL
jgi:hypothetical protein